MQQNQQNKINKLIQISITLIIIAFVAGITIGVNWYRILTDSINHNIPEIRPIRRLNSLAFIFVAILSKFVIDSSIFINEQDNKYIKAGIFSFVFGEFLIANFDLVYTCLIFFALGHIFLIFRHLQGFNKYLEGNNLNFYKKTLICIISGIITASIFVMYMLNIMLPLIGFNIYFIAFIVYGLIVASSVWAGFTAQQIKRIPNINRQMSFFGMASLFCTDMVAGYGMFSTPCMLRSTLVISNWFFYMPTIPIIAMSAINFNKLLQFEQIKTN